MTWKYVHFKNIIVAISNIVKNLLMEKFSAFTVHVCIAYLFSPGEENGAQGLSLCNFHGNSRVADIQDIIG